MLVKIQITITDFQKSVITAYPVSLVSLIAKVVPVQKYYILLDFDTINYPLLFIECKCDHDGSEFDQCNDNGKCTCKPNVVGDKCDKCAEGYEGADFPHCSGKKNQLSMY